MFSHAPGGDGGQHLAKRDRQFTHPGHFVDLMVEGVIDELPGAALLKVAFEIVHHTAGVDVGQVRVEQVAEDIQMTASAVLD